MTTVPVTITYKGAVNAKDRDDLKNIITQKFNAIAPTLHAHQVVLGNIIPTAQTYAATIPEHNIDSLSKTLRTKNFEIHRDEPKFAI